MTFSAGTANKFSSQQIPPCPDADQVHSLLVFYLGERGFGLLIEQVVQIIPMLKLTPVPRVAQVIEGVANIHGNVVPVLSARRCLGMPLAAPRLHTPIILVRAGDRMLGLIVDRVADVIHVPDGQMTRPGEMMAGGLAGAALLAGVVYQGAQAIIVIAPCCLLYPDQMQAVNRAIEAILSEAGSGAATRDSAALAGKLPQKGQSKPLRKRRKLEATLAGEMATLAADLPPSDGRPADPAGSAPKPPGG
jgi:purine-binding chemotaxis protein CheW